jgi:hypothetical protein
MPVSPNRKFDFKLNLAKLNQMAPKHADENTTGENSYGFWTTRSARVGLEEQKQQQSTNSIKVTDERYRLEDNKDYFIKKNYNLQDDKKPEKTSTKNSNSLTKSHPTLDFKFKENEIIQTMKNFSQPASKNSLSSQIQANLQEVKKGNGILKTESSANRYAKKPIKK